MFPQLRRAVPPRAGGAGNQAWLQQRMVCRATLQQACFAKQRVAGTTSGAASPGWWRCARHQERIWRQDRFSTPAPASLARKAAEALGAGAPVVTAGPRGRRMPPCIAALAPGKQGIPVRRTHRVRPGQRPACSARTSPQAQRCGLPCQAHPRACFGEEAGRALDRRPSWSDLLNDLRPAQWNLPEAGERCQGWQPHRFTHFTRLLFPLPQPSCCLICQSLLRPCSARSRAQRHPV